MSEVHASVLTASAQRALAAHKWPQTVLLTSRDCSMSQQAAAQIAAGLVCRAQDPPCGACNACRKVFAGIHPDVTLLDKGGSAILVDDIRTIRSSISLAPNEADCRVYLIAHAQDMNPQAQNAALKMLEEAPAGIYFILLCENDAALLQTVLSRCMKIRLSGEEISQKETSEAAAALLQAAASGSELELLRFALANEKMPRSELSDVLDSAMELCRSALLIALGRPQYVSTEAPCCSDAAMRMSVPQLCRLAGILLEKRQECDRNIGTAHILGTIPALLYLS